MPDHSRPDDTRAQPGHAPSTGVPRWLKVSALVVVILAVVIVAVMFISGGEHGPGRHTAPNGTSAPASVPADHTPPTGIHQ